MESPLPRSPSFVARRHELATLDRALAQALGGELTVRLVAGEAGAGKTALVNEFIRRSAAAHGALSVAIGECNAQSGAGDPYLPFRDVLSRLTGDGAEFEGRRPESKHDLVSVSLRALAENAPDLVGLFIPAGAILARLGSLAARRLPWADRLRQTVEHKEQRGSGPAALEQGHLFEQYANMVRSIAMESPLIIVLDDLHWVDPGSAGLLFHLSRRLRHSRVLILGTYRPEEVALGRNGERHPLDPVLHELVRYGGDITIDLSVQHSSDDRDRLDELVDLEPNTLGEGFRAALYEHTRGHPLFTLELLRNLQERGDLRRDEVGRWDAPSPVDWRTVPPRVEGVIGERIARLEEELRQMLLVASVEGEDFTAEVVARVRVIVERDAVRRLSGELERQHRLVDAREQRRIGPQRLSMYQFRHNLIQKYLYHSLDDIERSYLHEDVGTVLETLHGASADDAAVQLARHFEAAGRLDRALHYRRRAGHRARQLSASPEAIEHYRAALALFAAAAAAGQQPGADVACELHEGLADVLELSGRHADAAAEYEAALGLNVHEVLVRARLWRKSGHALSGGRQGEAAVRAFDHAARELGGEPPAGPGALADEWIQLQLHRMEHDYFHARGEELARTAATARPFIERFGTPRSRGEFFHRLVLMHYLQNNFAATEETARLIDSAFRASQDIDEPTVRAFIRFGVGFDHLWARRVEPAEACLREALGEARRVGDVVLELRCLTYLAVARRFERDTAGASELAVEALRLAEAIDAPVYVGAGESNLAWADWHGGRPEEAIRRAEVALACWAPGVLWPFRWLALWPLIAALADRADVSAALDRLRQLASPMEQRMSEPLRAAIAALDAAERSGPDAVTVAVQDCIERARDDGLL